jgi:hypothetical protein
MPDPSDSSGRSRDRCGFRMAESSVGKEVPRRSTRLRARLNKPWLLFPGESTREFRSSRGCRLRNRSRFIAHWTDKTDIFGTHESGDPTWGWV